ncbi:MAG: MFS transporter [Chloroflexota bacterium]
MAHIRGRHPFSPLVAALLTHRRRWFALLPSVDLWRLVLVRALRSLVQGYLLVVFAIYLGEIGFPAWLIGVTLTSGGIVSAGLTLLSGVMSDRLGRRPFLLAYGALLLGGGMLFAVTTVPWVLIVVSALAGIGRAGGGGGQAGPFGPAEQALIAEKAPPGQRTRVYAINSIVGTLLSALGALLAGLPELLRTTAHLSLLASYRPLFLGVALVGALSLLILWPLKESPIVARLDDDASRVRRRKNRRTIRKISVAGAFHGFGFGFLAGIVPYWLHVRFGVSPGAIAPVITASALATSLFSLLAVRLAGRFGEVSLITGSRLVGAALTLALPFAPLYPVAAALYAARLISNMMAMPVRQSYTMGIVDAESRGSAAGVSGVARRLPASISPSVSGYWIGVGALEMPFVASAFFSFVNAVLYYAWFRSVRPIDEIEVAEE